MFLIVFFHFVFEVLYASHISRPQVLEYLFGAMDIDSLQALYHINDISSLDNWLSLTGNFTFVLNWEGRCVGDDVRFINDSVTRVVAFQTAGCIGEIDTWVDGTVS